MARALTCMWSLPDARHPSGGVLPVAGYRYDAGGWATPLDELEQLRSELGFASQCAASVPNAHASLCVSSLSSSVSSPASPPTFSEYSPLARVTHALLWLRPAPFIAPLEDSSIPLHQQSIDHALRAYPSEHTCLVANVLTFISALREGSRISRFVRRASIPPVYLACTLNFERCDESGELFTVEPAAASEQSLCAAEAKSYPHEIGALALDPHARHDWAAYFRRELTMTSVWEVWFGDDVFLGNAPSVEEAHAMMARFVSEANADANLFGNGRDDGSVGDADCSGMVGSDASGGQVDGALALQSMLSSVSASAASPTTSFSHIINQLNHRTVQLGDLSMVETFTLSRTSFDSFEATVRAMPSGDDDGDSFGRAGIALVFRHDEASHEPFGVWFGWLLLSSSPLASASSSVSSASSTPSLDLVIVDLQNSVAVSTLGAAVARLEWTERPRNEVFFAALSRDKAA